MAGHYFYLIPLTAALANLSLLPYFLSGRGDFERIMRGLLLSLTLTNLGLLLVVTSPDREAARLYLHFLRHTLVCVPLMLLLLSNYLSGRKVFTPAARTAVILTVLFLILIQFTFFSRSTLLVQDLQAHAWGFFPRLNTGGLVLLGGLFLFSFLNSMYVLARRHGSPLRDVHPIFAVLILVWWLGLFSTAPALLGSGWYPLGNAVDAVLCIVVAAVLHRRNSTPGGRILLLVSELLAAAGFGMIIGGLFLMAVHDGSDSFSAPVLSLVTTIAAVGFLQYIKHKSDSRNSRDIPTPESLHLDPSLSKQERRICELIHAGYTRRQIAFFLSITDGTLRNHLASIYGKTLEPAGPGSRDQFQRLTVLLNRSAGNE